MTFDVHAHVVVPEITREAGNGEAWRPHVFRDEAGAQVVEMGGKPIRAAIAEFVDIDGILAAQDKADVDRLLLCPWVPLLYYDADPDESLVRARIQNDALAQLVRDHPERVAALGALPLQDPELAARELQDLMAGGRAHMVVAGVMERHPGLRVLLAHGGGALLAVRGRMRHAHGFQPQAASRLRESPEESMRRFYFDTLTHDDALLRALIDYVGPE